MRRWRLRDKIRYCENRRTIDFRKIVWDWFTNTDTQNIHIGRKNELEEQVCRILSVKWLEKT